MEISPRTIESRRCGVTVVAGGDVILVDGSGTGRNAKPRSQRLGKKAGADTDHGGVAKYFEKLNGVSLVTKNS